MMKQQDDAMEKWPIVNTTSVLVIAWDYADDYADGLITMQSAGKLSCGSLSLMIL